MKKSRSGKAGSRRQSVHTLVSQQEEQNKSLARELHDVISQKLAAFAMEIEALERKPPETPEELRARLRGLAVGVARLAETMHEISRQIHPAILDDLGLAEALKSECLIFSDLYQTPVAFRAERVPVKLPEEVALCLYRIAQEGLRNIGKHARHAEAAVTLTGTGGGLRLSIEDAGPGTRIDPAARHGLGLISIKERARLVKGKVRVVSRPGRGTVVKVDVPLGTGAAGPMKPAARRHAASRS